MKTKTKKIILKLFVGLLVGFFIGFGTGKIIKDKTNTAQNIETLKK